MKTERKPKIYDCPVETTIGIIGGKWKSVILYYLFNREVMRFSEFRRMMPKITQQMLTAQLRELEADALIHRKIYPQVPPKVEYRLTEFGMTLKPIILAMKQWGISYEDRTEHEKKKENVKSAAE